MKRQNLELVAKFRRGSLLRHTSGQYYLQVPFRGMYKVDAKRDGLNWIINLDDGSRVPSNWFNP